MGVYLTEEGKIKIQMFAEKVFDFSAVINMHYVVSLVVSKYETKFLDCL